MRRGLGLVLAMVLTPIAAQAEPNIGVRADCTAAIAASTLSFDDQAHRLWYNRFWTGQCAGLFGCLAGNPNWNALITRLGDESAPAQRAAVQRKACEIGHLVGYEWARDNGIRRIDTNAVRGFLRTLQNEGDPMTRLETIERRAREMLNR